MAAQHIWFNDFFYVQVQHNEYYYIELFVKKLWGGLESSLTLGSLALWRCAVAFSGRC